MNPYWESVRDHIQPSTHGPGQLRSPSGMLHLRAEGGGIIEEDGLSAYRARCGWESTRGDARATRIQPDDPRCRRCPQCLT